MSEFRCPTVNTTNLSPQNLTFTGEGSLRLTPTPTNQLPASPSTGQMVYDSTTGENKVWTGSAWKVVGVRTTMELWTDATRPTGLVASQAGYVGYNTQRSTLQRWTGTEWIPS